MKCKVLLVAGLGLFPWGQAFAQAAPPTHEYMRGEYVVPCSDNEKESCIWHRLIVDNQTANTLECRSRVAYDGPNRDKVTKVEHKMVVDPNSRKSVLGNETNPEVKATSHSVDCVARKPYDDSKLTPNCKATLTKKPEGGIDYPQELRTAGQEGPVLLEFSLSDKEGAPTDIKVVGSSLWPKLDASAIKYVSQYAGVTECKKGRFRMPLTFRLK